LKKYNLLDCFPKGKTPREQQIKLLQQIQPALESDKKFIVINAPTGSGKSMIAATLAEASNTPSSGYIDYINSYRAFCEGHEDEALNYAPSCSAVLTVTKNLQNQYTKDFDDLELLKGKNNYICDLDSNFDVEDAPCNSSVKQRNECWACNRCPYYEARNHTLTNKFGVYNYSVFLNIKEHVRPRDFIICDEASELENILIDNFAFEITYEEIENILEIDYVKLTSEDPLKGHEWLRRLCDMLTEKQLDYEKILKEPKHKLFKKTRFQNKQVKRMLQNIEQVFTNWNVHGSNSNSTEYIVEKVQPDKYNKNVKEGVIFTPLRANKISRHLFDYGEKVILLSATIIDHRKEMGDLGIGKDDYVYIEAENTFDPKKSPIRFSGKYPLTYKTMDKNLPKVIEMVTALLNHHKEDNGLVHTVNFKITQALQAELDGSYRYLFREAGKTNEKLIEEHKGADFPTVMVSPSMTHGVDLAGDLGVFQIMMKTPYLPLSSKRIKRLCKEDYHWYVNKTLAAIVQASGRCTRSVTDESITYFVDATTKTLIEQHWDKLPRYFRDRII
jgi:ATP-dependent DNA helicase DinG